MTATLLDKLIDAMDAADEHTRGEVAVQIILARGCLNACATRTPPTRVPTVAERMMSLDMVESSVLECVAREIVEQAVSAT